jgi:small multidrug resistance family-3 protein
MNLTRSALLFVVAGLMEIGGGYLVWQWLRHSRSALVGMTGVLLLALYGVVATYQPAHFGRVYAAYGGVFVAISVLWGWGIDRQRPDAPDVIGALLCIVGAAVMMYWPRSA